MSKRIVVSVVTVAMVLASKPEEEGVKFGDEYYNPFSTGAFRRSRLRKKSWIEL